MQLTKVLSHPFEPTLNLICGYVGDMQDVHSDKWYIVKYLNGRFLALNMSFHSSVKSRLRNCLVNHVSNFRISRNLKPIVTIEASYDSEFLPAMLDYVLLSKDVPWSFCEHLLYYLRWTVWTYILYKCLVHAVSHVNLKLFNIICRTTSGSCSKFNGIGSTYDASRRTWRRERWTQNSKLCHNAIQCSLQGYWVRIYARHSTLQIMMLMYACAHVISYVRLHITTLVLRPVKGRSKVDFILNLYTDIYIRITFYN